MLGAQSRKRRTSNTDLSMGKLWFGVRSCILTTAGSSICWDTNESTGVWRFLSGWHSCFWFNICMMMTVSLLQPQVAGDGEDATYHNQLCMTSTIISLMCVAATLARSPPPSNASDLEAGQCSYSRKGEELMRNRCLSRLCHFIFAPLSTL